MANRVYQGRFKGDSLTHLPNDKFRYNMNKMGEGMPSYIPWICSSCDITTLVHKLEHKIFRCHCGCNVEQHDG